MDAILEFKVHAIIRDIDMKPSERDVENAIKELLCEYLGVDMVEISELSVGYERINKPWRGEEDDDRDTDKAQRACDEVDPGQREAAGRGSAGTCH